MGLWLTVLAVATGAPPSGSGEGGKVEIEGRTDDDWGFETGSGVTIADDVDEVDMVDFVAAELRKPPKPTHSHLYPDGKAPLTDQWAVYVDSYNDTFVVLELPVLVASDRASFLEAYPEGLVLIGEWSSGGHTLTVRQEVRPGDVLAQGATFAFLKAALPNPKPVDHVRVVVKTGVVPSPPADPGEGPAPAPAEVVLKERFARTTVYARE